MSTGEEEERGETRLWSKSSSATHRNSTAPSTTGLQVHMFLTLSNVSYFSSSVAHKWPCFADSLGSCGGAPVDQSRRKKLKAVNGIFFFPVVSLPFDSDLKCC